jgi:hypothetical protein
MKRTIGRIAGVFVALALVAGLVVMTSPSYAVHADRVAKARHSLLGKSVHNKRTHLTVTTIGTWKFYRRFHGHKVPFWSYKVSAQRQHKNGEFYGRVKEGRIRPPHQEGKPPRHRRTASRAAGNAAMSFCLQGTTVCADPWNWVARNFPKPYTEVNKHVAKPCIEGSIVGYGGVASTNLAAWMLMEAGAVTRSVASRAILGPEGAAVVSLSGCFIAISKQGTPVVQTIYDRLLRGTL